ncbi:MAG: peptidylprolyl isomerase [Deltaproteobacteria bacterium]|nr:peptidylprolyl isomerase [Deltaproteobacteria bacterium]
MKRVKNGDRVRIHFTGRFPDGRVFATSSGREPIELTVGDEEIMPGFREALVGMMPGESKTTRIAASKAFGERHEDRILRLDAKQLQDEARPQVGDVVQLQSDTGIRMSARVIEVTGEDITLDANHPLAGHELTFEIEMIAVGPAEAPN